MEKTYGIINNSRNKQLIEKLESNQKELTKLPSLINTQIVVSTKVSKSLLDFDWIVFSDIFAVDYFIEYLNENNFELFELDNLRVCAFGESVADKLRFVQLHSDIISQNLEPQVVFNSIKEFLFDENELSSLKVLMPKDLSTTNPIFELLKNSVANVTEFPLYESSFSDSTEISKLKVLLQNGAIDEFIFTSPEDVFEFEKIIHPLKSQELFGEMISLATNEMTFQTVIEHNIRPLFLTSETNLAL